MRRAVGEEFDESCIQTTVKHGGRGIMVWGCMTRNGLGNCIRVEGNIDQFKYLDILQNTMIPSGHQLVGQNFTFQYDNAPSHSQKCS